MNAVVYVGIGVAVVVIAAVVIWLVTRGRGTEDASEGRATSSGLTSEGQAEIASMASDLIADIMARVEESEEIDEESKAELREKARETQMDVAMTAAAAGDEDITEKVVRRAVGLEDGVEARGDDAAASRPRAAATEMLQVPNNWGVGDGSPLLVQAEPDLSAILGAPDPAVPQEITDQNEDYWEGASVDEKRSALAMAYLNHPDAEVRAEAASLAAHMDTTGVTQELVDCLADDDEAVSEAAARAIWQRDPSAIDFSVRCLRDEVRGHSSTTASSALTMGRGRAIRALDQLVEAAPDAEARQAIEALVDKHVAIPERVPQGGTDSVEFVGLEERPSREGGTYTHEVYRAASKAEALRFLQGKAVTQPLYYIEVETPDGKFGRDIDGVYNV